MTKLETVQGLYKSAFWHSDYSRIPECLTDIRNGGRIYSGVKETISTPEFPHLKVSSRIGRHNYGSGAKRVSNLLPISSFPR